MAWSDFWDLDERVSDLSDAYAQALREAPGVIWRETGYAVGEFFDALLPALLQMGIVVAATTVIGAGLGAGLGALVFGVGAIPGAALGTEVGLEAGIALLNVLGLGFLAVMIASNLGEVTAAIKSAVMLAWNATDRADTRRDSVRQAAGHLAHAMALLVRLVLMGIVLWITERGAAQAPELIARLKASRLGAGFGEWVENNLAKLTSDPRLRPHRGEGSTSKPTSAPAQSPSQLAKKPPAEEPPPPPPPPKSVKTFPKSPDEMTKTLGVEPSKVGTTPDGTQRVVWEPNANTRIRFESHPEGLSPNDPGFNPRHHGEHYHIEMKPDGMSWNQANKQGLITKAKPDGYLPGQGTGFVPGEPFPGQ